MLSNDEHKKSVDFHAWFFELGIDPHNEFGYEHRVREFMDRANAGMD